MARFGRPIWPPHEHPDELAISKIIGGNSSYDPLDPNQVFSILSFRLNFDLYFANPVTLPLPRATIDRLLQRVEFEDHEAGKMYVSTLNEPILAKAGMFHLCDKFPNWDSSVRTFSREYLNRNMVGKGEEGELYSRIILTLSHDSLALSARGKRKQKRPTKAVATLDPFSGVRPTFTVKEYLEALYRTEYHQELIGLDGEILSARMNFLSSNLTTEQLSASARHR